MKQCRIIVSGRVQGVFFRDSTRGAARSLGLKGYVRNAGNGDVEVIAQGDEKDILELIKFCHKGPPASEVDKVDVKYEEIKDDFIGFEVRY